jgi:hypothetical protein
MIKIQSSTFNIQHSTFNAQSQFSRFNFFPLILLIFAFYLVSAMPILAQTEDELPDDVAPPPLKILSKEEKSSLESQTNNIKKRTKISIELMDARIEKAEKFQLETNFKETLVELAGFQALLDNTLDYLFKTDSGKSDRSFINFEIYLRKQIPRIESIRREMPLKYGYHVGNLMKAIREARAKAVEPLFDDTVVPTAVSKKP